MHLQLPPSWQPHLADELEKPYFTALANFLEQERASGQIFPPADQVFSALQYTPYDDVKVVILGQDPYHDNDQAHGLAFSVCPGIKPPPSLRNMFKELHSDVGCAIPAHGYLVPWARQGVLLLNAVLTVSAHRANSHKGQGWEQFTDAILRAVNQKPGRVVFLLWGGYAHKKRALLDETRHAVIATAHPSPLSAHNGFFGSRPFSRANELLQASNQQPIDWCLPPEP